MTSTIKYHCVGIQNWTPIDENHAVGEFTAQLFGWSTARRFVVLRERASEDKEALGRKLIDVPGYTFRVWVTNRSEGMLELWRNYNGRATIEQRIEDLKNDLAANGFCLKISAQHQKSGELTRLSILGGCFDYFLGIDIIKPQ
jgi:hypothetical protein